MLRGRGVAPLVTVDVVHVSPQTGLRSLVLALACLVALTACGSGDETPVATHTREPGLTSSSSGAPEVSRVACSLLKADERQSLAGTTMNVVVPAVTPKAVRRECQWVHSLKGTAQSTIKLTAFTTESWAGEARPLVTNTLRNPRLGPAIVKKLRKASRDLAAGPSKLSSDRICEIYWLVTQANAYHKGTEVLVNGYIGQMRAVNASACSDGVVTVLGYGEYGLKPSLVLYRSVVSLRKVAHERAVEELIEPTAAPTRR